MLILLFNRDVTSDFNVLVEGRHVLGVLPHVSIQSTCALGQLGGVYGAL